jgi:pyridinium-3,5-bisthiocarboxylic acid mononucleotide nickel chelatase
MALAALVDAGADWEEVRRLLERLPIGGWDVEIGPTERGDIGALKLDVTTRGRQIVRTHAHIVGIVEEARLPDRVRDRALAVFATLAEAEGRIHRRPAATIHFHEVGGVDAMVDIIGTCAALEVLAVDRVCSGPVAVGMGMVRSAHGHLPNPAPAVVELLKGAPTYGRDVPVELTTPTGAALLAALVPAGGWGPLPSMTISSSGFGSGTAELEGLPNLCQVVLGEETSEVGAAGQPTALIEANLDDATGETLAWAVSTLLEAGARDAWVTPVVAKKGRPAHVVSALADLSLASQVAARMASETGSLGVRVTMVERRPVPRRMETVEVDGLPVRVKVGPSRAKAEHEDAARVARLTHRPLRLVTADAEDAWRHRSNADEEPES